MKKIKDLLIDKVNEILEFKVLAGIGDEYLSGVSDTIKTLIDDQFIETATEKGIAKREKMLGIQLYADDNIENRKFRVSAAWNNQLPYTYKHLQEKLESLVGENGYLINLVNEDYTLIVRVNLGQKRMLQDVDKMTRNMIPANLLLSVELQYNRHVDLARFTHAQLKGKTHAQIRAEVLY